MAKKVFSLLEEGLSEVEESTPNKRISGIRAKYDDKMMREIRDQIDIFRREKFASEFPARLDVIGFKDDQVESHSENDGKAFDLEADDNDKTTFTSIDVFDCESQFFDRDKMKEIIVRNCGEIYWDFLESGHPLARFWVQLRIGLKVIPKSEYVYFIQSILEKHVESASDIGCSRVKIEFMKKYGFESNEEVEEYLMTILEDCSVENIIRVD